MGLFDEKGKSDLEKKKSQLKRSLAAKKRIQKKENIQLFDYLQIIHYNALFESYSKIENDAERYKSFKGLLNSMEDGLIDKYIPGLYQNLKDKIFGAIPLEYSKKYESIINSVQNIVSTELTGNTERPALSLDKLPIEMIKIRSKYLVDFNDFSVLEHQLINYAFQTVDQIMADTFGIDLEKI